MPFYNELSPFYDQMISFETRFANEQKLYKTLIKKYPAGNILDAGCGSGYHSILLSSLGVKVTGFDPAEKMLELAEKNARKYNYSIDFFKADYLSYPEFIINKFDAIYTLGNSFVHLTSTEEILAALTNFKNTLNPNGYVCIGIINYDKIIKTRESTISKKEKDGIEYHRYYTFNEKTVTFNIKITGNESHHFKTELYPLQSDEFKYLAGQAGFKKSQIFGNMKQEKYNQFQSDNIVAFLKI